MVKMLMKSLLSKVLNTPLVIEEGSDGLWYYRKWSNGTAECWRNWYSESFAPAAQIGGYYARVLTGYSYPAGLFVASPQTFFNLYNWGTGYFWGQVRTNSKSDFGLAVWRNDNAASTGSGSLYAIGKWK